MLGPGRRTGPLGLGLLVWSLLAHSPRASAGDSVPQVRVRDGFAAAALRRALPGARRRLANPECRRILLEFATAQGTPLISILEERDQTPEGYLDTLLFYDGSDQLGCAARRVGAITTPGSRAVLVCPSHLLERNSRQVEALIIHEMLHSLGLGENPPSSTEITARIVARCGL